MDTSIMNFLVIFGGVIVVMFLTAYLAVFLIKKKHNKKRYDSLPSGGTDSSDYSEMLVQKYRNERIEKEL